MLKEINRRTQLGLTAIKEAYGQVGHEEGVTLFVDHHLQVLPESYWQTQVGEATPSPTQVLSLLVLHSHWGEDEVEEESGLDHFDFTLPDDVTNYVLCVSFDEAGEIDSIGMES